MIRSILMLLQHMFVALACLLSFSYTLLVTGESFVLDSPYGGLAAIGLLFWSLVFSPIIFGLVFWLSMWLLKTYRIQNRWQMGIQLSSFSLGLIVLLYLQTMMSSYGLWVHESYHERHFSNSVVDYYFFGAHVGLFGVFAVSAAYISYRLLSNNSLTQQKLANNNNSRTAFPSWKPLFVLLPLTLYFALIGLHIFVVPQPPPFIG